MTKVETRVSSRSHPISFPTCSTQVLQLFGPPFGGSPLKIRMGPQRAVAGVGADRAIHPMGWLRLVGSFKL